MTRGSAKITPTREYPRLRKNRRAVFVAPTGQRTSAIVRTVHGDGTATVQLQFELSDGIPVGPMIGRKRRVPQDQLSE